MFYWLLNRLDTIERKLNLLLEKENKIMALADDLTAAVAAVQKAAADAATEIGNLVGAVNDAHNDGDTAAMQNATQALQAVAASLEAAAQTPIPGAAPAAPAPAPATPAA